MSGFFCTVLFATALATAPANEPVIPADATAPEILAACRTMIPREVELSGRLVLRNRRGIVQKEHAYCLTRREGKTTLLLDGQEAETPLPGLEQQSIAGTDVTWSDLTLDYLWWTDVSFDTVRESETVHGQVCRIIVLKTDVRTVRVWVDFKTGAMMQAEECVGDRAVRRLWGTRIKKFGDRWAPHVLEVETLGSGHRTKIIVEEIK